MYPSREELTEQFDGPMVAASITVDTELLEMLHHQIRGFTPFNYAMGPNTNTLSALLNS